MVKAKGSSLSRSIGRLKNLFKAEEEKKDKSTEGPTPGLSKEKSKSALKVSSLQKKNSKLAMSPNKKVSLDACNLSKEDMKTEEDIKHVKKCKSREEPAVLSDKEKGKHKTPSKPDKLKKDKEDRSIFEDVQGGAQPAQAQLNGVKNKMRWKIDLEPAALNGSQKVDEIREKIKELKKKGKKGKKEKTERTEEEASQEDKVEEEITLCAKIMQIVRLNKLIEKELVEADQEILRNFCRAGSDEEKAETIIEKLSTSILSSVVVKNEFCRTPIVPGQLRIFAVEEKTSKRPLMAMLLIRKDLLYVSWSKGAEMNDYMSDPTWANMVLHKK